MTTPIASAAAGSRPGEPISAEMQRAQRRRRTVVIVARLAIVAAFLAIWHYASGRWASPMLISSPADVVAELWKWVLDGSLVHHASATLQVALLGFLAGSVVAIVLGLVLGRIQILGDIFDPILTALYALPRIALVPLFILWFGIGLKMKVINTSILVFFLMFINVYAGTRSVDHRLVNAVRVMGGSRLEVMRYVVLPSAFAWIAAGLKAAIPYALVGAVVSEMFAGNLGLGYLVARSSAQFFAAGTFSALVVLLVVGYGANALADGLSRRALRWRNP